MDKIETQTEFPKQQTHDNRFGKVYTRRHETQTKNHTTPMMQTEAKNTMPSPTNSKDSDEGLNLPIAIRKGADGAQGRLGWVDSKEVEQHPAASKFIRAVQIVPFLASENGSARSHARKQSSTRKTCDNIKKSQEPTKKIQEMHYWRNNNVCGKIIKITSHLRLKHQNTQTAAPVVSAIQDYAADFQLGNPNHHQPPYVIGQLVPQVTHRTSAKLRAMPADQ
ncbi:uncharacterized protein G2W53_029324 [Senna tora]|uniref:Uncharacterized protein n=1 Tax=Senna tora TaxID=362788 RepID=A0A834T5F4_9FABA|nr:uncharacterized protein G2W53_029324 [Senna tora]